MPRSKPETKKPYSCSFCELEIKEIHVLRAANGEETDVVILPNKRVAHKKCFHDKLISVEARGAKDLAGALLALIDRMYEITHRPIQGGRMYRVKTLNPNRSLKLHEVIRVITDIFGHYFDHDPRELFRELSNWSNHNYKLKLSEIYSFLYKEFRRKEAKLFKKVA